MKDDVVLKMLRQVASGEVSVEDAREALEGVSLSEEAYDSAVNHGVFNEATPGSIVRASVSPSGDSWLVILIGLWGIIWSLYWAGSLSYGLYNHWDQQLLSFFLAMLLLTVIILGMVYMKYVMPDILIVKNRRGKYITPKDPDSWKQYKV
ncbi:MAG: hypothetical protein VX865_03225 [Candidatus Thermoplasmatota archaeon]|jgi:hypothetical protein|nr:hypothetical protein [Candidatus Thermoplasmatota archaeon]MED5273973.1 hypothetical protein [Candidatus Thermoplasmatota archaeon]|tara:strand:+ start:4067 stop:4516 length:450 start_codon:yes stop_codon:yes gene_type:complete